MNRLIKLLVLSCCISNQMGLGMVCPSKFDNPSRRGVGEPNEQPRGSVSLEELKNRATKKHLEDYGAEDASLRVQKITDAIAARYNQLGLLKKKTPVQVKLLSTNGLRKLERVGASTHLNRINNGNGIIHIHPEIENELSDNEISSVIAHELAHTSLRQKGWKRNPHYWTKVMHDVSGGLAIAGVLSPMWLPLALMPPGRTKGIGSKNALKLCGLLAGGAGSFWYLQNRRCDRYELPRMEGLTGKKIFVSDYNIPLIKKAEEIVCDITAATALEDGGHDGKELYKKLLKYNGDSHGVGGDHPWTSNRIWYHELIENCQRQKKSVQNEDQSDGEEKERDHVSK